MNVDELIYQCALRAHDPNYKELSQAQWLTMLQSGSQDLRNSGWLLPINDDSSLLTVANTFVYTVPTGFAYIYELRMGQTENGIETFIRIINQEHYRLRMEGGLSVFYFLTLSDLEVGKHIMVIGQKRPTIYVAANETIDAGVESFLRERTLAYGLQYLAGGGSVYAKWRQVLAGQVWNSSERFLRLHPQEFRVKPGSLIVPGQN